MAAMKRTVYVLEDDPSIAALVKLTLLREDIDCKTFGTVKEFEAGMSAFIPDLCLLDVMLPDGNGFEVLRSVKSRYSHVSCIMLSALSQETDKVQGLNMGADDYVAKPFGVMELAARVKANLRRCDCGGVLIVGGLTLCVDKMTVTLHGEELDLNKKEFELLKYCMQNADKVLSRETLLTEIWGYVDAETRTLDNHVARLRKLGIPNFETVFGVGYRFKTVE